jgi:hypothetical protein
MANEGEVAADVTHDGACLADGFAQLLLGRGQFDGPIADFVDVVQTDAPLL